MGTSMEVKSVDRMFGIQSCLISQLSGQKTRRGSNAREPADLAEQGPNESGALSGGRSTMRHVGKTLLMKLSLGFAFYLASNT